MLHLCIKPLSLFLPAPTSDEPFTVDDFCIDSIFCKGQGLTGSVYMLSTLLILVFLTILNNWFLLCCNQGSGFIGSHSACAIRSGDLSFKVKAGVSWKNKSGEGGSLLSNILSSIVCAVAPLSYTRSTPIFLGPFFLGVLMGLAIVLIYLCRWITWNIFTYSLKWQIPIETKRSLCHFLINSRGMGLEKCNPNS